LLRHIWPIINRKSATENLRCSDVLADHYPAKPADHLSDGSAPFLCLDALLSEIRMGVGDLCTRWHHRRAGWSVCAPLQAAIAIGTNPGSDCGQTNAGHLVYRALDAHGFSRSGSAAPADSFLGYDYCN